MEQKIKNISFNVILVVIAIGIWVNVLQNAGIIPTNQNVKVVNTVSAQVHGSVDVDNTVQVTGYIDVNLDAINGKRRAFYDFNGDRNFVRIPVYTGGNWD